MIYAGTMSLLRVAALYAGPFLTSFCLGGIDCKFYNPTFKRQSISQGLNIIRGGPPVLEDEKSERDTYQFGRVGCICEGIERCCVLENGGKSD